MSDFNPFAALIDSTEPAEVVKTKPINNVLEEIFSFTLSEDHSERKHLLLLEEIAKTFNRQDLDLQILQHALFDRLFMCNDENSIIKYAKKTFRNSHSYEVNVITYLYTCYRHLKVNGDISRDEEDKIKTLIIQNTVTAFIQSDIYHGQQLEVQLLSILKQGSIHSEEFFKDFCQATVLDEDGGAAVLKQKLTTLLLQLTNEIKEANLVNIQMEIFNVLKLFTREENLADILLDAKPARFSVGADYANTPLGSLFNISILPKKPGGIYDHFQDPMDKASIVATETLLWQSTNYLIQQIHSLYKSLLTCSPQIKTKTLAWLGTCLNLNADRRKLWNSHSPVELNPSHYTSVTDGFMCNFTHVLLQLCQPFCKEVTGDKILKVDPTYCGVPSSQQKNKDIHLMDMHNETCLLPRNEDEELQFPEKYNFVTECFYLAHRSLDIGYQVIIDKLMRLNHEVARLERTYVDAVAQGNNTGELAETLKTNMISSLRTYLSLKAQLSNPQFLSNLFELVSASAYWLSCVSVNVDFNPVQNASIKSSREIPINFPLSDRIPYTLKCIPEFLIENIVCNLVFLRRFIPKVFEEQGLEKLKPVLTFILIFMGSPERIKNPHLRARLAEALEALLPYHADEPADFSVFGGYQREMLFSEHEHRSEIVTSLLKVFVEIEMTGQSVEFEQKFNYRRPMYPVMYYLWSKDEFKKSFKLLAEEAEKNMMTVTPPLFLRFINLLLNDSVFLLDEALANMAKLKELETARENGEWDAMPSQERVQNMRYMHQIGMIARFDNILGKDTIKILEKLTSEITIVFTHATLVDRVAAMLNYFLYNLVGPKMKTFKVKHQKEYSFDPADTVLMICKIYVNLKQSDEFCLAIFKDGRSYSPELFELAENVLVRIGGGLLIGELKELAAKVEKKAREHKASEDAVGEVPDHFLDPIMLTLMTDPVILPSSKQTVDRNTIARHLLSDQTDPFNRAPLTMDQVIPNVELAEEIQRWFRAKESQ